MRDDQVVMVAGRVLSRDVKLKESNLSACSAIFYAAQATEIGLTIVAKSGS